MQLRAAIPASLDEALTAARELAAAFREGAARRDAERILPGPEVEDMTRRGLYGLTVPAWLGGPDLPAARCSGGPPRTGRTLRRPCSSWAAPAARRPA